MLPKTDFYHCFKCHPRGQNVRDDRGVVSRVHINNDFDMCFASGVQHLLQNINCQASIEKHTPLWETDMRSLFSQDIEGEAS